MAALFAWLVAQTWKRNSLQEFPNSRLVLDLIRRILLVESVPIATDLAVDLIEPRPVRFDTPVDLLEVAQGTLQVSTVNEQGTQSVTTVLPDKYPPQWTAALH